jgi:hypothetical protein
MRDLIKYYVSLSLKHLLLYTAPKRHCEVVNKFERLLEVLELPPPPLSSGDLFTFWRIAYTPKKYLQEKQQDRKPQNLTQDDRWPTLVRFI